MVEPAEWEVKEGTVVLEEAEGLVVFAAKLRGHGFTRWGKVDPAAKAVMVVMPAVAAAGVGESLTVYTSTTTKRYPLMMLLIWLLQGQAGQVALVVFH